MVATLLSSTYAARFRFLTTHRNILSSSILRKNEKSFQTYLHYIHCYTIYIQSRNQIPINRNPSNRGDSKNLKY